MATAALLHRLFVNVRQDGAVYTLDGWEDPCGAAQRAPLVGVATVNPDGSIGFGLNIVSPTGQAIPVQARISMATLGGTWSDAAGNGGASVFGANTGGGPRPNTPSSGGDITRVEAGTGLTGGGSTAAPQTGAVTSAKIADGAVTTIRIADAAVTSVKIAGKAINSSALVQNGSLRLEDLINNRGSGAGTGVSNVTIAARTRNPRFTTMNVAQVGDIVTVIPGESGDVLGENIYTLPTVVTVPGRVGFVICNASGTDVTLTKGFAEHLMPRQ